jgi:hypothetical protein
MVLIDLGSVVSWLGLPEDRAVTGLIGVGAEVVFFTGGLSANLTSIFQISRACIKGDMRAMRSASFGFVPSQ